MPDWAYLLNGGLLAAVAALGRVVAIYGARLVAAVTRFEVYQKQQLVAAQEANERLGRLEGLIAADRTVHLHRSGLKVETNTNG